MSDEENTDDKAVCKMGDDLIAVVRELVQLSLLTGTNIVDHLRAILLETDDDGKLVPTQGYFEAYHSMIDDLNEQAKAAAAAQGFEPDSTMTGAETAEVPS